MNKRMDYLVHELYDQLHDKTDEIFNKMLEENPDLTHSDSCNILSNALTVLHAAIILLINKTTIPERRDELIEKEIENLRNLINELRNSNNEYIR